MENQNIENKEELIDENLKENELQAEGFDFSIPNPSEGEARGPVEAFTDNLSATAKDFIDNRFQGDQKTKEDFIAEREQARVDATAGHEERQEALDESTNFFDTVAREGVRAPLGAIEDAANSVLLTADKTGDEVKKQLNQVLGRPVDPEQDPSSDEYESWYDGSNKIIGENQTGVGKFARGVSEFMLLTRWTHKALGGARANFNPNSMVGLNQTKIVRAAHPMYQSNRFMRIATGGGRKVWQIGTEGAIADFIMSSSEGQNMANLAQEHAPWLLPDLMAALSARPEDTWYQERFKSALVGTAFNFLGYTVAGISKGGWKVGRWLLEQKKAGKDITEEILKKGDEIFNIEVNKTLNEGANSAQEMGDRLSKIRYDSGKGIDPRYTKTNYIFKHLGEEDQLEYARLLDGKEPSEWFVNNLKKRGKADLTEIEVTDEDSLWREAFNNLSDDDFLDVKGIMNMPQRVSLRELAMNDYFELAQKIGGRAGDEWLPVSNMSRVQRAENALRETDEFVNADKYPDYDKQTYEGGIVKYDKVDDKYKVQAEEIQKAIDERQWNWKENKNAETVFRTVDEPYISQAAAGNKDLYDIYKEVAEDLDRVSMGMREDNFRTDVEVDIAMATPFLEPIEKFIDGKSIDLVKEYKRILRTLRKRGAVGQIDYKYPRDPGDLTKSGRVRTVNITTPDPLTVRSNMFVLHSIGKFTAQLAKGTLTINNKLPTARNWDMFTDLMKVLMIENKKWGYNWGRGGQARQGGIAALFRDLRKPPKEILKGFQAEADEVIGNLKELYRSGDMEAVNDLLTMAIISEGKVNSIAQIPEYLGKYLRGGRMKNKNGERVRIDSRIIRETYQTVINSFLGHPKTAVNSFFMTNLLTVARGFEAWYGIHGPIIKQWRRNAFNEDSLKGTMYEGLDYDGFNKVKTRLIGVQYAAMVRAQKEGWNMFIRNWEINMKPQLFDVNMKPALDSEGREIWRMPDYGSRYDDGTTSKQWTEMSKMYDKYGGPLMKGGKLYVDSLFNINKLPISRWSRSALNAGDAYNRTIVGRMQMSVRAAEEAFKLGVDPDDLAEFAKVNDEIFRKEIFRKNKDDVWVVKDPRAKDIADESTLMRQLGEFPKQLQFLERHPLFQRFFVFMRPSLNNFGNTINRTPVKMLFHQYDDIVRRGDGTAWGVVPDEIPRAQDELIGRIALGTTLTGLIYQYARMGNVVGDLPKDQADRDHWRSLGIVPNSFAVPKPWNPMTQARGDNGWMYISFGRSDIASTLFSWAANVAYYEGVIGQKASDEQFEKIKWYTSTLLADTGFIQSTKDIMNLLDGTNDNGINFERAQAKLLRPNLGFQGQSKFLTDMFDNTRKESNSFMEYAREQDFLFRSNIPDDYDVLGKTRGRGNVKPLRYGPHNFVARFLHSVSPFQVTMTEGDSLKQTLFDIRYPLDLEYSSLGGVELNSQEKSDLKLVMAEDKNLRSDLERLINSENWQNNLKQYKELGKKRTDGWDVAQDSITQEVRDVFTAAKERAVTTLKDKERFPEYNNNSPESLFNRIYVRDLQKEAAGTNNPELKKSFYDQIEKIRIHGTTGVAPQ